MTAPPTLPARHPDAPAPGERLGPHYDQCFGCGEGHPTGLHVVAYAGEGLTARGEFTVTPTHQGAPGLAHGGLLGLAFDEVLGLLGFLIRTPMVTGRLETEFLRPVPVGTTLHIAAQVDRIEGRKVVVSAEGRADAVDGPVAVRASAVFITVDLTHFITHGRAEDLAAAARGDRVRATLAAFEVNP